MKKPPLKKLLIISYYWPPSGGGGVQRWLKFTKYIRSFGWEPVIYTPSNGEAPVLDESLLKEVPEGVEVVKTEIWEPYNLYKQFTGKKKGEKVYSGFISENKKPSFTQKASVFIRGNFFIPDARKFWIDPSIKFLKKYLKENPVDAMVSTGPPHSMHLIALGVKKSLDIPWVADFRDPWTNIDFYDQLMLTNWADKKHKRLEKEVLKRADKVVTVSWSWKDDFVRLGEGREITVINNGYDHQDFETTKEVKLDDVFSITHLGSMNKDRNPEVLWKALSELCKANPKFQEKLKIRLIGQVDFSIPQSLEKYGLTSNLEKIDFVPHSEAIQQLLISQVLLLPVNDTPNANGVLPGKLYEYLGAKRPIVCIGPIGSDANRIMDETASGGFFPYDGLEDLKLFLQEAFAKYETGNLFLESKGYEQYARRNLCEKYCQLLDSMVS